MPLNRRKAVAVALITSMLESIGTGAYASSVPLEQQQTVSAPEKKKPKVETIEIRNAAEDNVLFLGSDKDGSLLLTAIPKDKDGNVIETKKIVWKADNKKVATVDKDGNVTAVGIGTTEITAKMENVSASFEVTVKDGASEDAEDVAADKAALVIGFAEGDSATGVTADVSLPTTGANGSAISWQTSDADVVKTDGNVTRPAYGAGDKQVTLTATLTKGNAVDTQDFLLTVKELPPPPSLSVEKQTVNEAAENDGSIADQQVVTLQNGTFAADLAKAEVQVNNLPAGLDFELESVEPNRLTIRFTGKAASHFDDNDVSRASITVAREKVTGAKEDLTSPEFLINFEDPATVSIPDAKQRVGQTVTIKGIVTADNSAIGGGKLSTYMQDGSAGINIFNQTTTGFPELKEGDQVFVTGKIAVYRGLTEIVPTAGGIQVASSSNSLPQAKETTIAQINDSSYAEPLEGTLVKVTGYISSIPGSPAGGGYNISLIDQDFKGTTLRVMQGSIDVSQLQTGNWYEVTAILSQFDNSYQLIPRKPADVQLLQDQPEPPDSAGTYPSVVSDVVDGDTIHLTEPVLGSTTVRFVNIDTPETYHVVRTPADQNQKAHGERAKMYMRTLLASGDRVQVKVGSQAKDSYGRLLGQVVRERDGLVTNLQMVRSGFASTYFIWPIDDDAFKTYQEAVKEAELEGRGIWNPYDPLLELPFAFRAREQGKGFTRHVGNYDTKTYVAPENWIAVPVESRVFFNSEEEAQANGYSPMDSEKLADALSVANAKSALQVPYDGTSATIQLPAEGTDGTAIDWSVKDPAQAGIINLETGAVDRSGLQTDTIVLLLATIHKGSAVQQKGFPVLVKKLASADEQAVAAAKAALQVNYDGQAAAVELPSSGAEGTTITWALQNNAHANIVDVTTGAVNRSGLTADTEVGLVATISKGAVQDTKQFTIVVKAEQQPGTDITELFFSEYLEGSGNNKALEIFNGTGSDMDLSAGKYAIALFTNGSTAASNVYSVTGTLSDGGTFVVANPFANSIILGKAQATSNVTFFNGDDAIVLYKNYDPLTKTGDVVDVIGVVGIDPGSAWGTTVKTVDQTLVRKGTVHAGNTNTAGPFDPAVEWESKGVDYVDSLGSHTVTR